MNMTIYSGIKTKILEVKSEASKDLKAPAEMLRGLDAQFERKDDYGLYFMSRTWIPSAGNVSPWKGVVCLGRKGKLAPRYVGAFKIMERVGPVAYRLRLPQELSSIHDTFHVSNLKKCLDDASSQVPLVEIEISDKLHFVEEPVEIFSTEDPDLDWISAHNFLTRLQKLSSYASGHLEVSELAGCLKKASFSCTSGHAKVFHNLLLICHP
ncbi:hypothetical protein Tco_1205603 [Tanacetum coccineum]